MDVNTNLIILIFGIILIAVIWHMTGNEPFWDRGYSRQAYLGQPFTRYGLRGAIAATDDPKMLIDPSAVPENPPYCKACHSYDPDVIYNHY